MGTPCLEIAEIVTSFMSKEEFRDALRRGLSDREVLELIAERLPADRASLWQAEIDTMPPGVMPQFAQAIRTAAENSLAFSFVNTPPDDVMGFARDRAIDVSFRYTETEIVARIAHTNRHPSWLADRVGVPS